MKKLNESTRQFTIEIREQFVLEKSPDYFREYKIMDTFGPPEPEELQAFLTRAINRFMRKWSTEKHSELMDCERKAISRGRRGVT